MYQALMELSPAFAWLFLLIAIAPLLNLIVNHLSNRHSYRQKNLELLLEAYTSENMTPYKKYVIESLFSGIYKKQFTFPVIEALFKSKSPLQSFDLYSKVSPYVKMTDYRKPFRAKKRYSTIKLRGYTLGYWISIRELLYYLFSSSAATLMFGYAVHLVESWSGNFDQGIIVFIQVFILCVSALLSSLVAIHFLRQQGKITYVKTFLRWQTLKE